MNLIARSCHGGSLRRFCTYSYDLLPFVGFLLLHLRSFLLELLRLHLYLEGGIEELILWRLALLATLALLVAHYYNIL